MWEDKTVDYSTSIYSLLETRSPQCSALGRSLGHLNFNQCNVKAKTDRKYLCQVPDTASSQHSPPLSSYSPQQSRPSLATVNVVAIGLDGGSWWPVMCPSQHMTHVFMVCDIATSCWAKRDVTFSRSPQSWALPTPKSCPAQLALKFLPPSFPCRSENQRVPYTLVCDHRRDCQDGSDETFCSFKSCDGQTQFQCLNKQVLFVL